MSEAKGIKESLEVLEGVKVLGVAVKKIAADGKLNLADAPALLELGKNASSLVAAVENSKEVPAEAKDLSPEELQELGTKFLEVVAAIRAA